MRAVRPAHALIALAAVALSGCASWNDRYPSTIDSAKDLFGFQNPSVRDWPSADIPVLPPLSTDSLPNRRPSPGVPMPGWPPLAPSADGDAGVDDAGVDPARAGRVDDRAD